MVALTQMRTMKQVMGERGLEMPVEKPAEEAADAQLEQAPAEDSSEGPSAEA